MLTDYLKFLKTFRKVYPDLTYDQLRTKAKGPYKKWKDHHNMVGGGIVDSINNFLWHFVAKPLARRFSEGYKNNRQTH